MSSHNASVHGLECKCQHPTRSNKRSGIPIAIALDKTCADHLTPLAVLFLWNNGETELGFECDQSEKRFYEMLEEGRISFKEYNLSVESKVA